MTDTIFHNGLIAAVISLRHTLAKAMVDATTACQDLESDNIRAAVGAVIPIGQALDDAKALFDTVLIFNRTIN